MFNIIDIPQTDRKLELLDRDDGHWYKDESGKVIPSITTLMSIVKPKEWYKFWIASLMRKHDINHEEALLKAEQIGKSSMNVGSAMHKLLEEYISNEELTKFNDEFEKPPLDLFNTVKVILDESVKNVHATEYPMYSKELGVAGTVDMVCEFDGELSIVDYKNSRSYKTMRDMISHGYCEQVCAYGNMWNETFNTDIKQGVIIVASWDDRCRVFKINLQEYLNPLLNTLIQYEEMLYDKRFD